MKNDTSLLDEIVVAWLENASSAQLLPQSSRTEIKESVHRAYQHILKKRIQTGLMEEEYREKYGQSFDDSLEKVRKGDVKSACRLIEWNKFFIGREEVVRLFIRLEMLGLKSKLEMLADSASKIAKKSLRKHSFIIGLLRRITIDYPKMSIVNLARAGVSFGENIEKILEERGEQPTHASFDLLSDQKELEKFIRRNKSLIYSKAPSGE